MNILLFCDCPDEYESASTVIDHIQSFEKYSKHQFVIWSSLNGLPDNDYLNSFDCLIIHYSISILYDKYVTIETLEKIKAFKGLKVLFIQDEYRRVNFACKQINYAGVNMLFTCAPKEVAEKMYGSLNKDITIHTTLTGYVPEKFYSNELKPISKRATDIGYRARKVPFYLGKKGVEKYVIGKQFLNEVKDMELICDISSKESDRLYGRNWTNFISNCKATLGTESGSSIIDFTGEIEYQLNFYQAFHPFAKIDNVPKQFLRLDGKLEIQVISPRCFEAAALGTALVLFPGEYSGILKQNKHYIPLEKDFSNISEVVDRIKDVEGLQQMTQFTREDLVKSKKFSYEKFIIDFDEKINQLIERKGFIPQCRKENIKVKNRELKQDVIPVKKSLFNNLIHKLWKILPDWLKFILMVTVLRKKYFCHFDKKKYSYLAV